MCVPKVASTDLIIRRDQARIALYGVPLRDDSAAARHPYRFLSSRRQDMSSKERQSPAAESAAYGTNNIDEHTGLSRRALLKMLGQGAAFGLMSGVAALTPWQSAFAANAERKLRIGYQKYGNLILLKGRGTLEKRLASLGASVEWLEFPAGPQLMEGLNAGAVDIGSVGETPPVFAQAAGVDFVYVANEPAAPAGEAIVVPHDSPIQHVSQLKGKKVALNKGSNVHFLLLRALEKAGLKYSDIHPIYLTPSDGRAAFTQGSIDAWVIWDPFLAAVQHQANARVLVDGTGLVSNLEFYVAARRYATSNADLLHALIDELRISDAWGREHQTEVASILAAQTGLDLGTVQLSVKRTTFGVTPITDATLAYQQQIADAFDQVKLIPKPLTVSSARWAG